ncbi:MAG: hypothetical protein MI741_09415, partial [Rhodospirillales bacterium]|nr:hypothetical protein [Rhodospirillales bacterium]
SKAVEDGSKDAKLALVTVLARRSAVAALSKLSNADDADVARMALTFYGKLADDADSISSLVNRVSPQLEDPLLQAHVRAIITIARSHGYEELATTLAARRLSATRDSRMQEAYLNILGALPTDQSLAMLTKVISSKDHPSRDIAIRQLARWPDARAIPTLNKVIETTDNATQRAIVLRAMVQLATLEQVPTHQQLTHLQVAMKNAEDDATLKMVIGGFGKVKSPVALAKVLPYLDDPDLRDEAAVALLQIAEATGAEDPSRTTKAMMNIIVTIDDPELTKRAQQVIDLIDKQ